MIFTLKIITMMSRTLKRHDFAITNYNDDEQDSEKAIMLIRVLDHEVAYLDGNNFTQCVHDGDDCVKY